MEYAVFLDTAPCGILFFSNMICLSIELKCRMLIAMMKELDPIGSEARKSRRLKRRQHTSPGPNNCWHVDGYVKLKPYGFPIHSAIDGYSHCLTWLRVGRRNKNHVVIAKYCHYHVWKNLVAALVQKIGLWQLCSVT